MSLKEEFPSAVANDLGAAAYCIGIKALNGKDRQRLTLPEPRVCHGSANIDSALAATLPNDPRWDYAVAYAERLHFIEVHPAHTSAVSELVKKRDWLRAWL